jgi:hypothetical protein
MQSGCNGYQVDGRILVPKIAGYRYLPVYPANKNIYCNYHNSIQNNFISSSYIVFFSITYNANHN